MAAHFVSRVIYAEFSGVFEYFNCKIYELSFLLPDFDLKTAVYRVKNAQI